MFSNFVLYAAEGATKSNYMGMLATLALWGAVFYFLLIRPNKKRQKKHKEMLENLKDGVKVITAGGIKGEIVSVTEDFLEIRVDKGVRLTVKKSAISEIV